VETLARSQTLPTTVKEDLGNRLQELFARYPRKKIRAQITFADLQSYLSLPIWQNRHELYPVWIATEIVNALPDHICEIHHKEGKIIFGPRDNLIATVKSAWPPVRLISECRVPLAAPVGAGRKGNVQPDYGLWRQELNVETCGLVVEVKHYKKSDPEEFSQVLTDYSRAFPTAKVYLLSHGPIGDVAPRIPSELLARCHTIKKLTASHASAREELRKAVRNYVGQPAARPGEQPNTVLAIDVSPSMAGYLGNSDFSNIMQQIVDTRCGNAAVIDVGVRAVVPLDKLLETIMTVTGVGTSLAEPVKELLNTFKRVLVITDEEGLNSLRQISGQTVLARKSHLVAIEVTAEGE
jgi:hypothetical protein